MAASSLLVRSSSLAPQARCSQLAVFSVRSSALVTQVRCGRLAAFVVRSSLFVLKVRRGRLAVSSLRSFIHCKSVADAAWSLCCFFGAFVFRGRLFTKKSEDVSSLIGFFSAAHPPPRLNEDHFQQNCDAFEVMSGGFFGCNFCGSK